MQTKALIFFLLLLHVACFWSSSEDQPAEYDTAPLQTSQSADASKVKTTPARIASFAQKTVSSGILLAARQAEIKFRTSGILLELPLRPGQPVVKGALLARLDDQALQLQLRQRQLELEEARYKKIDLLLLRGAKPGDEHSVSPEVLENVESESGWKRAKQAIEQVEYEISLTKIFAPFDGVIADVKARQHQFCNVGETLCRLIDPGSFEAEFSLLENEAASVRPGLPVAVEPVAIPGLKLRAVISAINPVVSKEGLVIVRAKLIRGDRTKLFEGMNVRVAVERIVPNQLIVPKSAVVLRSGKPVVFTLDEKEGLAKWNYVTIALENDNQVAIAEGLRAGDLVIYEGNLNLDHDAKVVSDSGN